MKKIVALTGFLTFTLITGCGTTTSRQAQVPDGMDFACETDALSLFRSLDLAAKAESSESLDLLLLSGGGARGAWGAGFLAGWDDGPSDIPEFDIVTGVSTGALQATHAFLGDFDRLYEIYTTTTEADIYKKRSFLTALFSNSLLSSKPLGEFVESIVTDELLMQVDAASEGRMLCVGAVNLSTGMFQEWDLTKIAGAYAASDGDAGRKETLLNLYRTVLLGSAAIPLAFPPVEITEDGLPALYVDGGTRQNVFVAFGEIVDAMTMVMPVSNIAVLDAYAGQRMADLVPLNNYVVINGQLGIAPADVGNKIIPIALRSFDALMAQSANGALYQIEYEIADRERRCIETHEDPENCSRMLKTRYSYIPGEICLSKSALDFDPVSMTSLAYQAAKCGARQQWFEFDPNAPLPVCTPDASPCD